MPILVEEEIGVQIGPATPPEEVLNNPVICVFNPLAVHATILDHALGTLRKKVDVLWQASFSRTWIDVGGIDETTYPALIAAKKPILIISEIDIFPGNEDSFLYGLEMLENLRNHQGLKDTPLIIISNERCLLLAQEEEPRERLGRLKISQFFTWGCLQGKPDEQKRLFDFVAKVLDFESKP